MNSLLYSNCPHYSKYSSLIVPILFYELFMGQENYAFILRYLCNLPQNPKTMVQQLQDHS